MVKIELKVNDYLKIIYDTLQNEKIAELNEKIKYKKGFVFANLHILVIIFLSILVFFKFKSLLFIVPFLFLLAIIIFEATYMINKWESNIEVLNKRLINMKKFLTKVKEVEIIIENKEIIFSSIRDNENTKNIFFNIQNIDFIEYHKGNIELYNTDGDFMFLPVSIIDKKEIGRFLRRFRMDFNDVKNTRKF